MDLMEKAKEAIQEVFNDTSVGQSTTREHLEELKDEIDTYLDTLEILDED